MMPLTFFYLFIVAAVIMLVAGVVIFMEIARDTQSTFGHAMWTLAISLIGAGILLIGVQLSRYDDVMLQQAKYIMAYSHVVYKDCINIQTVECTHKIRQWKRDSVYWTNKTNAIINGK